MNAAQNIFLYIASNKKYLYGLIGLTIILGLAMNLVASGLNDFEQNAAPDLAFGFTNDYLKHLYAGWGEAGRSIYLHLTLLDFVFIPCYTLLVGTLLVLTTSSQAQLSGTLSVLPTSNQAKMSGSLSKLSSVLTVIPIIIAIGDIIETSILRRTASIFPDLVGETVIHVGSLAQQMKWTFVGLNIFLVSFFGTKGLKQKLSRKSKRSMI
jgi:hypothetical protein